MKSQPDLTPVFSKADEILIQKRWTVVLFAIVIISFFYPFCRLQTIQKQADEAGLNNINISFTAINYLTDSREGNIDTVIPARENNIIQQQLAAMSALRILLIILFFTAITGLLISWISRRSAYIINILLAETGLLSLLLLRLIFKRYALHLNMLPDIKVQVFFQVAYWVAVAACFLAIGIAYIQWKYYKNSRRNTSAKTNNPAIRVNIITQHILPES